MIKFHYLSYKTVCNNETYFSWFPDDPKIMSEEAEFLSHLPGIIKAVAETVTVQYGSDIGSHVVKVIYD